MLQKVLFGNREVLLRHGLLYPDVSLRGYGHHDLAFLVSGGYPEWAIAQPRSLNELSEELAVQARGHDGSVLISSEDFYLLPNPRGLLELLTSTGLLENRRIRIIVYVRRQDQAHESWYNQTIKAQGYTHEFDDCVAEFHDLWDYEAQLRPWAETFGRDNCIVRPFEERQFSGGSLLEDFFGILGVPTSPLLVETSVVNTSLNRDLLEFQRCLNRLPLAIVQKRRFHRELTELTVRCANSGLFDESAAVAGKRTQVLAAYRESNARVAASYLGRAALFLDEPDDESAPSAYPGLTLEKIASIAGWLLIRGTGL